MGASRGTYISSRLSHLFVALSVIASLKTIQGDKVGRGGLDVTPSDERAPPEFPQALREQSGPLAPLDASCTTPVIAGSESASNPDIDVNPTAQGSAETHPSPPKLLPRESGLDVGMGSPVPLSAEAVGVITRLRNMKDEDEDWSRWRDVVFRAKGAKLNLDAVHNDVGERVDGDTAEKACEGSVAVSNDTDSLERRAKLIAAGLLPSPFHQEPDPDPTTWTAKTESGTLYCTECYLPLHPDPDPNRLYIFLHALRYTTSIGSFETKMPVWADERWTWEGR